MNQPRPLERFYSLDVLRGIAALSIIFWHWQHFFFVGSELGSFDRMQQPFAPYLSPLYTQGQQAVDLFFCLSGFIFFWLYSARVRDKSISPTRFASLRISRLYPLHFATLILVTLLQTWIRHAQGTYFVYQDNDLRHFLLQLFFASSWGLERGYSFNGPIWSVSVEVLLYTLFFIYCRLFRPRPIVMGLIALAGGLGIANLNLGIGRGIGSFFLGGCVYFLYRTIAASSRIKTLTRWITTAAVASWGIALYCSMHGIEEKLLTLQPVPFLWRFDSVFQRSIHHINNSWPIIVVFPLTILSLALLETRRGTLGKRISAVGDLSYSSYLLHFPLQVVFYGIFVCTLSYDRSVFLSPWMLLLFFAVLIPLSICSYHYLEVPAQALLRRLLLTRSASKTATARS